MALRDFTRIQYLPLIDVRPAELVALEELPAKDKDLILPMFKLRPWVGTDTLQHAVNRLLKAYGHRSSFLELGEPELLDPEKKVRQVHAEIGNLRDPQAGYKKWVDFFGLEGCEHFIPVLQWGNPDQFLAQAEALLALDRGLGIRVDATLDLAQFAKFVAPSIDAGKDVVFVIDFGKQSGSFAGARGEVKQKVQAILDGCANAAAVAVSASSFPSDFTSTTRQDIFERKLFNSLRSDFGDRLVFSDRGSARAEALSGGGGLPAPRIDFAKADEWVFFRQDKEPPMSTALGYQRQAKLLMDSADWDAKLKLWGCQMIEKTAVSDDTGIFSANRCTAARINIHVHQQLHYGDSRALYDTDEEWTDL